MSRPGDRPGDLYSILVSTGGTPPGRPDDLYAILGVPPDAPPHEIASAYERLADIHGPDDGPGADPRAVAVALAYYTLSDPARRASYERRRRTSRIRAVAHLPAAALQAAARGARALALVLGMLAAGVLLLAALLGLGAALDLLSIREIPQALALDELARAARVMRRDQAHDELQLLELVGGILAGGLLIVVGALVARASARQ